MKPKRSKAEPIKDLSRRDFLVTGSALIAGATAASCLPGVDGDWPPGGTGVCSSTEPSITMTYPAHAGRVVEVQDLLLTDLGGRIIEKYAAQDLENLLLLLTGKADLKQAWSYILPDLVPGQVVGIKVNVLNQRCPTQLNLVKVLVDLLKTHAEIKPEQILVWDRRLDELTKTGFTEEALGCKVEGTLESPGNKGAGRGYEFSTVCIADKTAKLSNIQTRAIDHLINVAVMKNHMVTGYTGALKNHYGTIDNPGEFHKGFERAIPQINALDEVASKSRLWILDAAIGVSRGDTDSPPDCAPHRLAASLDPVALDVRGREIRDMEAMGKIDDTQSESWIQGAEQAGLGKSKITVEVPT